jgi:hypothetical protein
MPQRRDRARFFGRNVFAAALLLVGCDTTAAQGLACGPEGATVNFDFYVGVGGRYGTFAQSLDSPFALQPGARKVLDSSTGVASTQLCDRTIVLAWLAQAARHLTLLTGRLYDEDLKPLSKPFRVTESDEPQWEHSVAYLLDEGFIVTWKTFSNRKKPDTGGVKVRARVLDSRGHPLTRSIDVSHSGGNHGQASAYGLPNGEFVVTWSQFGKGAMLRVFGRDGKPRTSQILVSDETDISQRTVPYGFVTAAGRFNVFLRRVNDLQDITPFRHGRSYDWAGHPQTDLLSGASVLELAGYRPTAERALREKAHQLEHTLREFTEKDFMGFRFCSPGFSANLIVANTIKRLTQRSELRAFALMYCQRFQTDCPPPLTISDHLGACLQQ